MGSPISAVIANLEMKKLESDRLKNTTVNNNLILISELQYKLRVTKYVNGTETERTNI